MNERVPSEPPTPEAEAEGARPPTSRRSLLAAAAAGATALAAASLRIPNEARAANGGNLVLGQANAATSPTSLSATSLGDNLLAVLDVDADQGHAIDAATTDTTAGAAIQARGPRGGVTGDSTEGGYAGISGSGHPGVLGYGPAGVAGFGGLSGPATPPAGVGVYGLGDTAGVEGKSANGKGVLARSTTDEGVLAQTETGHVGVHGFAGAGTPPASQPEALDMPAGVYGEANGTGATGLWGFSGSSNTDGTGVYGEGDVGAWGYGGWGVFGAGNTGVYGFSGSTVVSAPGNTGVFGFATNGNGVVAQSVSGNALVVDGKLRLSRSGRLAIGAGKSAAVKILAGVTAASLVIAVLQTRRAGVFVIAAVPVAGKFTIYLNRAVTATTYVAFMVIN